MVVLLVLMMEMWVVVVVIVVIVVVVVVFFSFLIVWKVQQWIPWRSLNLHLCWRSYNVIGTLGRSDAPHSTHATMADQG